MSANKHTPGPWSVESQGDPYDDEDMVTRTVIGKDMGGGREVAIVTTGSYDDETEEANARLIAAAPAMCDALREIFAYGDGYGLHNPPHRYAGTTGEGHAACREIARAALALIDGEPK